MVIFAAYMKEDLPGLVGFLTPFKKAESSTVIYSVLEGTLRFSGRTLHNATFLTGGTIPGAPLTAFGKGISQRDKEKSRRPATKIPPVTKYHPPYKLL